MLRENVSYCIIASGLGDAQGQVGKRRLQGYWLAGKVGVGHRWDGESGALGTDQIGNQVVAEGAGRVTGTQQFSWWNFLLAAQEQIYLQAVVLLIERTENIIKKIILLFFHFSFKLCVLQVLLLSYYV